ncbi:MAG: HNH endonuclease signature motif containing protein, partial [Actinomycetota bacterium]|nr:HNH endonuclease signature motif containing protein [Actinomycetota bacterium]
RTFGLERDHVEPIAANGRTSIDNVQDLCYPCHQEKTERDRRAGLLGEKAKARRPGPPRRPAPASGSTASGPPEAHPSAPEMSTADPP